MNASSYIAATKCRPILGGQAVDWRVCTRQRRAAQTGMRVRFTLWLHSSSGMRIFKAVTAGTVRTGIRVSTDANA